MLLVQNKCRLALLINTSDARGSATASFHVGTAEKAWSNKAPRQERMGHEQLHQQEVAQKDFSWSFLQPRKKKHIMVTVAGVRQNYEDLVNPWATITIRGIFISCKYLKLSSLRTIIHIGRINWRPSNTSDSHGLSKPGQGTEVMGYCFLFLFPSSFSSSFLSFFPFLFETGSHVDTGSGLIMQPRLILNFLILLPLHHECWDCRCLSISGLYNAGSNPEPHAS